jgi:superfamily II DNA or RNA helicase
MNNPNMLNTYIGQKGYTLFKKELSEEQQNFIKTELTAKPYTPGAPGLGGPSNTFPVYRESSQKFYIPRYFGEAHFGLAKENRIPEGVDIDIKFAGELRDNQKPVVKTYLDQVQKNGNTGGGLLELPCAYGKCLGIDTEILMYDGTIKKVQDVIKDDLLMGDDSTPRKVLSLARGKEQMYKVETQKGEGYIVNESHILSLKCATNHSKVLQKGAVLDISVLDYLNLPKSFHGRGGVLYGYRVPIEFPNLPLPFDPYMMGYWLGDGKSRGTKISCQDSTVLHYFAHNLKRYKLSLIYASQYDYSICGNHMVGNNVMLNTLRDLDLIKNKHIPLVYKCNSRENRLKLLAGLIDSDGHLIKNGGFEFTQKNEKLIDDVIYLVRSLGFSCDKRVKKTSWTYKGEKKYGTVFRISINGKGIEEIPTIVPRKKSLPRRQIKDVLNYRIKLQKLEIDDYYGFEIDGNRRFVLGDFTVTHNTVLSLDIISQLKKKTLIIVHKEFLLNQWIERIQQFLPSARVGRIQGQIVDIEDKDIVIGMLQSLSMKDYHESTFHSFGLTIIDEVHHISSQVFSCALFKIVTKYTLGLSATMNRKDGTTKVFKMFLGEVVFKGKRDEEHAVVVRAIEYISNDEDFKKVATDFRGNVQYSTMISKLCTFNHRSEFILRVIGDMLKENPAQQIMILAHNRNLLTYFHDAIKTRNITSVGYYVGGMKEAALKESESKKVIVASYAMAAEGLDIKTLTTLIMATPKTDIEQSVGRILRERHGSPVVVDIIDEHQPFKNQWNKRKIFYKKQNYKIIQTNILDYDPDIRFWKHVSSSNKKEKENEKEKPCANSDEALLETCFIKLIKKTL